MLIIFNANKKHPSFNRYIVECKSNRMRKEKILSESFNRYIVECKFVNNLSASPCSVVLIDT